MNSRLTNLRELLAKDSIDAIFISSLPNITYITNFSGFSEQDRDAFVLVTKDAQYIFTHGIYKEAVKQSIKNFTLIDMTRENPISASVRDLIDKHAIKKLGFEAFDLKVSEYERLTSHIDANILIATNPVGKLRIIKSSDEIDALKNACALGDKAFEFMLKHIKLGVTENELAAEFDYFVKKNGAEPSFATIIAFEENAANPHHVPTKKKLAQDNFVLMDFGVKLNNYCSDMTRIVSFGKVSSEKKRIYNAVKDAQQKAIDFLSTKLNKKEKVTGLEIDNISRNYIISQGFPIMPHSLGHGIGLEVHESPRLTYVSNETLENGMVFSIEPGIYIPGNIGVRIEDLFAIENDTLVQITNSKRSLIEL